jgi:hypothetical protein
MSDAFIQDVTGLAAEPFSRYVDLSWISNVSQKKAVKKIFEGYKFKKYFTITRDTTNKKAVGYN